MNYPPILQEEKSRFVGEFLRAFRADGYEVDIIFFVLRASELWPCSHRLKNRSLIRCAKPEVSERLLSDPRFFRETATTIYWNSDEAMVGKPAIAAGLAETAANWVENASDLLGFYLILDGWFINCKIPFLTGDYQGCTWIPDVEHETPSSTMLRQFKMRIESAMEGEDWDDEQQAIEHQKLTAALDAFNILFDNRSGTSMFCHYELFAEATSDAKLLDAEFNKEVFVRRVENGWGVFIAESRCDMTNLVRLEEHHTFAIASRRARSLAIEYKQKTGIRVGPEGWEVLVSHTLCKTLSSNDELESDDWEYRDEAFAMECEPDPRWSEDDNLEMSDFD